MTNVTNTSHHAFHVRILWSRWRAGGHLELHAHNIWVNYYWIA